MDLCKSDVASLFHAIFSRGERETFKGTFKMFLQGVQWETRVDRSMDLCKSDVLHAIFFRSNIGHIERLHKVNGKVQRNPKKSLRMLFSIASENYISTKEYVILEIMCPMEEVAGRSS